ncbi:ABC transporter substrate-binding protein [Clostridium sp. YIM B02551]|uniref:ABC transporter substrate-binding protein n=1 Tax=Clostridium sp. YIM B02551 TaxID=2910679 RepID=UPI001EEC4D7A|nr:ABC transporter substrate-binding protein [Clostridium sp. YIM B02551]
MKKIVSILLIISISSFLFGCKKQTINVDDNIKILMEENKITAPENINKLIEGYKQKNSKIKVDIISKSNIYGSIKNKEVEPDIVISSRDTFIDIAEDNNFRFIDEIFEQEKFSDNFNNINRASGRVNDRYYGLGLFPYTFDFIYNPEALGKLGIKVPQNSQEALGLLKRFRDNNIQIPYILPKDITVELALSTYIANYLLLPSELRESYKSGKEDYQKITKMETIFSTMKSFVDSGYFNKGLFKETSIDEIKELEKGSIPIIFGTSYLSKNINENSPLRSYSNINLSENINYSPTGISAMVSLYANGKNKEGGRKFIDYLMKEEAYETLSKEGIITGSKSLDEKLKGTRGEMAIEIKNANENNLFYFYNLPSKYADLIKNKLSEISSGKYSGEAWKEVIDAANK